jgi:hypothetical protein
MILLPSARGARFMLFSMRRRILCQMSDGIFVNFTGSINHEENSIYAWHKQFEIKGCVYKEKRSCHRRDVDETGKNGSTGSTSAAWLLGLTLVVVIFVTWRDPLENLYVLHERYMDGLISMILKVFTWVWIILYLSAYRHETRSIITLMSDYRRGLYW